MMTFRVKLFPFLAITLSFKNVSKLGKSDQLAGFQGIASFSSVD